MSESFQPISRNLWLQQSQYFLTNCGVFIDQGQAAIIDPGITDDEIEEITRFLSGKKARAELVLLTHAHWDHILGAANFPGAKVIAQRNFIPETAGEAGERLRLRVERFNQEIGKYSLSRFHAPQPDITFSDAMTVSVCRQQLRLISTPGHAGSQMSVYHAQSGILWAGDMLSDIEIPLPGQSLIAYEKTLALLSNMEINGLIPGHGHASSDPFEIEKRLQRDNSYVMELHRRVEKSIASKEPLSSTLAACRDMTFIHTDENICDHENNIQRAYAELGGNAV